MVLFNRFESREYGIPREILEAEGASVTVASSTMDLLSGKNQTHVQPDVVLADVSGSDYDAIVFVGGSQYELDNTDAQRIASEALAAGRVVGAICIAPVMLARAGLVDGKRVTSAVLWHELEAAGAIVSTSSSVVRDGLLITANGPLKSREFGQMIAAAMGEDGRPSSEDRDPGVGPRAVGVRDRSEKGR
jgi:protease I